ncbi:MAG: patatin-like phospholipase family protein [Gammaproteobacteria bacterium]
MKVVTLALQGGGSHGAFTWGVLDRLLEDDRLEIEGISGASSGAVNAVVLANGFTVGGRVGAREALRSLWESVSSREPFTKIPDDLSAAADIDSRTNRNVALKMYLSLARFYSPYQLNPFNINPLRGILQDQLDFERLRTECSIKLFVAATQVSTGTLKLFRNKELTLDVILASTCLPSVHQAIEIDGETYWDGGLTANPPILPLLHECTKGDVVAVLLHPWRRPDNPKTADDIWHRLTEINFSSSFFTELQGLALARREASRSVFPFGRLERRLRNLRTHVIDSQELMAGLSTMSKLNTNPAFIRALHEEGRNRAEIWLRDNFRLIGARSSFDLTRFLYW